MTKSNNSALRWVIVFMAVFAIFYSLDQLIMLAQGLPLNWDLSPAQ